MAIDCDGEGMTGVTGRSLFFGPLHETKKAPVTKAFSNHLLEIIRHWAFGLQRNKSGKNAKISVCFITHFYRVNRKNEAIGPHSHCGGHLTDFLAKNLQHHGLHHTGIFNLIVQMIFDKLDEIILCRIGEIHGRQKNYKNKQQFFHFFDVVCSKKMTLSSGSLLLFF